MIDRFYHQFVVVMLQPPPPRLRPGLLNQMAGMYSQ
jgi:hypothetical protein